MKPTISTICVLLCTAVISGCATLEAKVDSMAIRTLHESKVPDFSEAPGKLCASDKEIINKLGGDIPVVIANFSISPDLAEDLPVRYEHDCNGTTGAYVFCALDAQEYTLLNHNTSLSSVMLYVEGLGRDNEATYNLSGAFTLWGFVDKYDKQYEIYRANDLATNKKILADTIESEIGSRAVSCRIEYIIVGRNKSNDFLLDFGWMISELRK